MKTLLLGLAIWWITCGSNWVQYNYVGDDNQIHFVRVSTNLWD